MKVKKFDFNKRTQDWNKSPNKIYINETLQSFCEYLKDLFCIDREIKLDLRPHKNNHCGRCSIGLIPIGIIIGGKKGIRASTVVHEFLHAGGFHHEDDINGYSDFRSDCKKDYYSPLIVKDIFGTKEVTL